MTDEAPAPLHPRRARLLTMIQGPRLGMVVLIAALLFLVFTVIYAINVAQSRHSDEVMAAATAKREAADQHRFEIIVRNQQEIIRLISQKGK